MTAGVTWALIAALGFGVTQTLNRKSNLIVGAYRTALGLLLAVEVILIVRAIATGEYRLLGDAPLSSLAYFSGSATIHYVTGWTLLAKSQNQIGVGRTGAVVSAAPLVATFLAAFFLSESLTLLILVGVLLSIAGVALVSISRNSDPGSAGWRVPWFGLAVAVCWGTSPLLIRRGLEGLDSPVLGLTVGLGVALLIGGVGLAFAGDRLVGTWDRRAVGWMMLGGVTGAVGIGAQWISFGLTTIAISITVQQLATLVVVGLAPIMFDAAFERINLALASGTMAMVAGSVIVAWAGNA